MSWLIFPPRPIAKGPIDGTHSLVSLVCLFARSSNVEALPTIVRLVCKNLHCEGCDRLERNVSIQPITG
jgi:hypothetical protein